jgi:integrase
MSNRTLHKLKAVALRTLRPGHHADGGGLYLAVSPNGAGRSWVFRTRRDGRLREIGLGSLDAVTLESARRKSRAISAAFADGRDPLAEKREAAAKAKVESAKATTFKQAAERYIASHEAGWRNAKHAAQWTSTLETHVYPEIGDLPVAAVDTALIVKVLGPIWTTKAETASRVRGRIEAILDYAKALGLREGENPGRWKGHLDNLLPRVSKAKAAVRRETGRGEHHAALPWHKLPAFMAELRQRDGLAARALEFAILTAARTGEVIGARWSEIDEKARLWTIPAERMKGGREHRVPLSEPALAILSGLERESDRVFPISNMAMLMLLRRMGRDDLTVHGFRSTFADWCAEATNTQSEVREMALAHAVGDKVEAAYRRGDVFEKRRELADAWAKYCEGNEPTDNVVALVRRAG